MDDVARLLEQARMAAARLERIHVDSLWARRAGGLRASLLRSIDLVERGPSPTRLAQLERLLQQGYTILTNAAREIPRFAAAG